MKKYRISKYCPEYRDSNGNYRRDEWTSISDVGKYYNGKLFTYDCYKIAENNYLSFCREVFHEIPSHSLKITGLENYTNRSWQEGQILCDEEIMLSFVRDCLREKCWGILSSPRTTIEFGYDYYLYITTSVDMDIESIAKHNHLFCEILSK